MKKVDINCDLGEGGKFDSLLMQYISTCNIACGGHYGNESSVAKTVDLALKNKVKIGAHPSYPDVANFGRKTLSLSANDLKDELIRQINLVKTVADQKGAALFHVKPHGALYNDIAKDEAKAKVVLEAVLGVDDSLVLFVPPKSAIYEVAGNNLEVWVEGFADRNYNSDYSLVARSHENAVLNQKEKVFRHLLTILMDRQIKTLDGKIISAEFDTYCIHSDTPNSAEIVAYIAEELPKYRLEIAR